MSSPRYLLDTDTCIDIINRRPAPVFERFDKLAFGELAISSITGSELVYGVAKRGSARNDQALGKFLAPLEILPFDESAMRRYGVVRSRLEQAGTPIGALDTLIAAHALALDTTLITNNERQFRRVAELKIDNWTHA